MTIPAIYYIPHQDDETLSMAIDIIKHVGAGREVICVLYTSGRGSVAQKVINGELSSGYWGGTHNPDLEGYARLNDAAFTEARNNEFRSALGQLGVKPENIHICPLDLEGTFNKDSVKQLMLEYMAMYPVSGHKTMSYHDGSISHAWAGQALNELYNEGKTLDARFFIARADWAKSLPGVIYTATDDQKKKIQKAARVYEAWNPVAGAFAVGYHSVPAQFQEMLVNPQNKIHKPNE
ncbi:PIG-L family deacetylase [Hazenella coriacea]|uniref:GlcNAc-PI de-N-acetylase n=1 Tax=Hazenella coriacea TaxID=1179467 RepID=A0A4R3L2R6_9BACL|nr:PIG-L family deacetylase [Hazenella coriacea]TCS92601.1 GlcNAc-PI de-N-acetylase [Hazenella coriacea]